MFFLQSLERLLNKFRGLFTRVDGEHDDGGEETFGSRWGLFSIIEAMSKLHNISINQVTELGAVEFLNWWAYITEKAEYERSNK